MRSLRALLVGAALLSPWLGAAKPRPPRGSPKATLRCAAASGEELSARSRTKLTEPVACSVSLVTEGRFNAILQARGKERSGPDCSGFVEHNRPVRVELKPGSDFAVCSDFEVGARLEDDFGKVLWTSRLAVRQGCAVKKLKAELACSLERNGKETALLGKSGAKLDGPVRCLLTSKDSALARARVTLAVDAEGRHSVREAKPVPDGAGWAARFELSPSADLGVCARSIALTAQATLDDAPAFEKSLVLQQECAN